jgi:alpha-mannan endo-1,2-alpha-mannanase / glycoprotein endo-alpha-1,2-mannosidase
MLFLYDSYAKPASLWQQVLTKGGGTSIRGQPYDAVAIGLALGPEHLDGHIGAGGFDGFYTYFAATGFTYGSTPSNWPSMKEWAERNEKRFIPCAGPGHGVDGGGVY